jgi:hypothetical protein
MRSPIKDLRRTNVCIRQLKEIIAEGSTLDSYLFFDGEMEFTMAKYGRNVVAHTDKFLIYEFWRCAAEDPGRLHEIVTSDPFKFDGPRTFEILQRTWPQYGVGFSRAALFFLLNRCSATGMISGGTLNQQHFNAISLNYLKTFKKPLGFNLKLHEGVTIETQLEQPSDADYTVIPVGEFSYNFFDHGKSRGFETTMVNHKSLRAFMKKTSKKVILIYNFHPQLANFFQHFTYTSIAPDGSTSLRDLPGEEVIVTNF